LERRWTTRRGTAGRRVTTARSRTFKAGGFYGAATGA
jgi:hypothetical protein